MGKQVGDQQVASGKESFTVEEVVKQLGVTPRTLHYYEEVGLVTPAARTAGGHRLYDDVSVEKLRRVLRLKDSLGYSLQEIKAILDQEQVLDRLKASWHEGISNAERHQVLKESERLLEEVIENIEGKLNRLETIRSGFEERLQRIRDFLAQHGEA